jgi:acid phosphatase
MSRPFRALLPAALLLAACSSTPSGNISTLLWMRTSAEYEALCLQAFAIARGSLDRALADPGWTACQEQGSTEGKPPAIIVDVDETILGTTEQESRRLLSGADEDEDTYTPWVAQASAPALPGAKEFLTEAAAKGVTVFYITNRFDTVHDDTLRNLKNAGLPLREDRDVLLCYASTPDKGPRRAAVCKDFRVLLQIGDAGGDFISSMAGRTPDERRLIAQEYLGWWGVRWIVLPNPEYGDWLRSVWGWKEMRGWEQELAERQALRDSLPAPEKK